MSGPLTGVRVLDVTQVMAGAYCAALLADMGADVVKVERPAGDDLRRWGRHFPGGQSPAFMAVNRNKRGIAVDLLTGADILRRLAATADIFVENFRPGAMQRLGLGYPDLAKLNPALVYCSISGFGQDGPYATRGGYDLIAQGMSGLMSVTGQADGDLVKVGVPVCDINAGVFGATGVLAAYINRLRTGQGQHVDTSLMEAGISLMVWETAIYGTTGEIARPMGSRMRMGAPYEAFRTCDGYITVGAPNQVMWNRVVAVLGCEYLNDDPRFCDAASRLENRTALASLLQPVFMRASTDEWVERFLVAGVPAGPVYDISQVYQDPQVKHRNMLVEVEHPTAGPVKHIGVPVKYSATPAEITRPAPLLGEHTTEILAEAGYTELEIKELLAAGTVRETA
jgi:crotonobetainyl-CoA:carnitine CoA-transferase CaiB-like acyl-CoA transferase